MALSTLLILLIAWLVVLTITQALAVALLWMYTKRLDTLAHKARVQDMRIKRAHAMYIKGSPESPSDASRVH